MTAPDHLPTEQILDISGIGGSGDGIAVCDGERVYVPFALTGEKIRAAVSGNRARVTEIISESPRRVSPFCPYFTVCGGCTMQHLENDAYRDWKRRLVETALAHRSIDCAVDRLVDAHGRGRRRTTLHTDFSDGVPRAGYMETRSHALCAIDACPILVPALREAPAIARALARPFARKRNSLDVQLTATRTGIDADIRCSAAPDTEARLALSGVAQQYDLARITADGEIIVAQRTPALIAGEARIALPPATFLQATGAREAALSALVEAHTASASRIVDLFCGVGPFALRLAERASIFAVDNDTQAVAALDVAARTTRGLKPLTVASRDLFRDPLVAAELKSFDAVVFDPPRAGAEAQAGELALSGVPVIVAVSCDPSSFARDAEILIAGGYRLSRVTPVDQFRHTAHVELVALFVRD